MSTNDTPYFISWSGGKDSCLALFRAMQKYGKPQYLLNMLTEDGERSRSHGLAKSVLESQAQALQIPIIFYSASWDNYEYVFIQALQDLHQQGIKMGVFGDIAFRHWVDKVCAQTDIEVCEPLWSELPERLLYELFDAKFAAKIIAVKSNTLSENYLGRILNQELTDEFKQQGLDPAGENGEYHTVVIDGPIFQQPLHLQEIKRVLRDGCWFLDVQLQTNIR